MESGWARKLSRAILLFRAFLSWAHSIASCLRGSIEQFTLNKGRRAGGITITPFSYDGAKSLSQRHPAYYGTIIHCPRE